MSVQNFLKHHRTCIQQLKHIAFVHAFTSFCLLTVFKARLCFSQFVKLASMVRWHCVIFCLQYFGWYHMDSSWSRRSTEKYKSREKYLHLLIRALSRAGRSWLSYRSASETWWKSSLAVLCCFNLLFFFQQMFSSFCMSCINFVCKQFCCLTMQRVAASRIPRIWSRPPPFNK